MKENGLDFLQIGLEMDKIGLEMEENGLDFHNIQSEMKHCGLDIVKNKGYFLQ